MNKIKTFISVHGVRIFAFVSAATTVLAGRYPELPWEAIVAIAAAILGVGEVSQRAENKKTNNALNEQPPAPAPQPVVQTPQS